MAAKAIDADAICVPESQVEQYRQHNLGIEIVAHPDAIKGLPLKRQWICDRFGDVFMVDDDVAKFVRLYQPTFRRDNKLTPQEARAVVEQTYRLAESLGVFLFSLAPHGDARNMQPQKPFRLTGYVNGGAFGLRAGSRLKFPGDVVAVEDMAISGLNAHYHRMMFMDERFGMLQKTSRPWSGPLPRSRHAARPGLRSRCL